MSVKRMKTTKNEKNSLVTTFTDILRKLVDIERKKSIIKNNRGSQYGI